MKVKKSYLNEIIHEEIAVIKEDAFNQLRQKARNMKVLIPGITDIPQWLMEVEYKEEPLPPSAQKKLEAEGGKMKGDWAAVYNSMSAPAQEAQKLLEQAKQKTKAFDWLCHIGVFDNETCKFARQHNATGAVSLAAALSGLEKTMIPNWTKVYETIEQGTSVKILKLFQRWQFGPIPKSWHEFITRTQGTSLQIKASMVARLIAFLGLGSVVGLTSAFLYVYVARWVLETLKTMAKNRDLWRAARKENVEGLGDFMAIVDNIADTTLGSAWRWTKRKLITPVINKMKQGWQALKQQMTARFSGDPKSQQPPQDPKGTVINPNPYAAPGEARLKPDDPRLSKPRADTDIDPRPKRRDTKIDWKKQQGQRQPRKGDYLEENQYELNIRKILAEGYHPSMEHLIGRRKDRNLLNEYWLVVHNLTLLNAYV